MKYYWIILFVTCGLAQRQGPDLETINEGARAIQSFLQSFPRHDQQSEQPAALFVPVDAQQDFLTLLGESDDFSHVPFHDSVPNQSSQTRPFRQAQNPPRSRGRVRFSTPFPQSTQGRQADNPRTVFRERPRERDRVRTRPQPVRNSDFRIPPRDDLEDSFIREPLFDRDRIPINIQSRPVELPVLDIRNQAVENVGSETEVHRSVISPARFTGLDKLYAIVQAAKTETDPVYVYDNSFDDDYYYYDDEEYVDEDVSIPDKEINTNRAPKRISEKEPSVNNLETEAPVVTVPASESVTESTTVIDEITEDDYLLDEEEEETVEEVTDRVPNRGRRPLVVIKPSLTRLSTAASPQSFNTDPQITLPPPRKRTRRPTRKYTRRFTTTPPTPAVPFFLKGFFSAEIAATTETLPPPIDEPVRRFQFEPRTVPVRLTTTTEESLVTESPVIENSLDDLETAETQPIPVATETTPIDQLVRVISSVATSRSVETSTPDSTRIEVVTSSPRVLVSRNSTVNIVSSVSRTVTIGGRETTDKPAGVLISSTIPITKKPSTTTTERTTTTPRTTTSTTTPRTTTSTTTPRTTRTTTPRTTTSTAAPRTTTTPHTTTTTSARTTSKTIDFLTKLRNKSTTIESISRAENIRPNTDINPINPFLPPTEATTIKVPGIKFELDQSALQGLLPEGFSLAPDSAPLPDGYEIVEVVTTTTEKSILPGISFSDNLAGLLPVGFEEPGDELAGLLPPGYKPEEEQEEEVKEEKSLNPLDKLLASVQWETPGGSAANILPNGYKPLERRKSTLRPTYEPTTVNGTTTTPSSWLIFPTRHAGDVTTERTTTTTTTTEETVSHGLAPIVNIKSGWPIRKTTEFTGWPTEATEPTIVELAASSTTTTTTTTAATTTSTEPPVPRSTEPTICTKDCKVAATIRILDGVSWSPALRDRNTIQWSQLKNRVEKELDDIYSRSLLQQWYDGVEIEAFSPGSVLVDYYLLLKSLETRVTTLDLRKVFHNGLLQVQDNVYEMSGLTLDGRYTDFIVVREAAVVDQEDSTLPLDLPQWAVAVIGVVLVSVVGIIIFAVYMMVSRRKRLNKRRQGVVLNQDLLAEMKNDSMGIDQLYIMSRGVPPNNIYTNNFEHKPATLQRLEKYDRSLDRMVDRYDKGDKMERNNRNERLGLYDRSIDRLDRNSSRTFGERNPVYEARVPGYERGREIGLDRHTERNAPAYDRQSSREALGYERRSLERLERNNPGYERGRELQSERLEKILDSRDRKEPPYERGLERNRDRTAERKSKAQKVQPSTQSSVYDSWRTDWSGFDGGTFTIYGSRRPPPQSYNDDF